MPSPRAIPLIPYVGSEAAHAYKKAMDRKRKAIASKEEKEREERERVKVMLPPPPPPKATIKFPSDGPYVRREYRPYLLEICDRRNVYLFDVLGDNREAHNILARDEFIWTIKTKFNESWSALGRALGKDHTTCISAFKRHAKRLEKANASEG